jgi:ParB-like chromosome segregation protein Spo0J
MQDMPDVGGLTDEAEKSLTTIDNKKKAMDSNFEESEHPRDESGKFSNGSGTPKNINPKKIKELNPVKNKAKFEELTETMKKSGWQGRPLLVVENNGRFEALTGSHRLFAARKAGLEEIPTVTITPPDTKDAETKELWNDVINAKDDEEREKTIEKLYDAGEVDKKVYDLISSELDINSKEYSDWSKKEEERVKQERQDKAKEKESKEEKQKKAAKKFLPTSRSGYADISKESESSVFSVSSFYTPDDFKETQNQKSYYAVKNLKEIAEIIPPGLKGDELQSELWTNFGRYNKKGFYIKSANIFLPVYPKKIIKDDI